MSKIEIEPTITRDSLSVPTIAIRAPLPDAVRGRIETEAHPRRGSCLILNYHAGDEEALIATLQETIDAVRRGPVR